MNEYNTPEYWETYYKIQEFLAKQFMNKFIQTSDGGVRSQSTLPPSLNKEAHSIANRLMDKQTESEYKVIKTDIDIYNFWLNTLPDWKRAMVSEEVVADNYYIVTKDNDVVGGFTTSSLGYLGGLFSLRKGIGQDLFDLRLKHAKNDAKEHVLYLYMNCYEGPMRVLAESNGFAEYNRMEFKHEYASEKWDYKKAGAPAVISLERSING